MNASTRISVFVSVIIVTKTNVEGVLALPFKRVQICYYIYNRRATEEVLRKCASVTKASVLGILVVAECEFGARFTTA